MKQFSIGICHYPNALKSAVYGLEEMFLMANIANSDPKELEKIIYQVLSKNKDKVAQYKSGKEKLFGYFVGEVMKVSKGKANPQLVNEILKVKLK